MKIASIIRLAGGIAILCVGTRPSYSQTAAATVAGDAAVGLQEIVVVAQRRQENVQNVPIAISAFSASMAEQQGVTDTESLASMVPGLQFPRQASQSLPFLRGVGTTINTVGDEPSVAYYVDDIYYSSGAASFSNFNSLDRIEVEKGPQGTLFGRNATGGVIQVFTKNPSAEPTTDIRIGYANYDTKSASVYASSAIVENVAGNIAVYGSKQNEGWGKNFGTGNPTFTGWDYGGRAKLLYTPTDKTTILFTVDADTTRTQQGIGFHPGAGTLAGVAGVPGFAYPAPSNYYDLALSTDPYSETRQSGASLKATQELSAIDLVSITAFRKTESDFALDLDVQPAPLINNSSSTYDKAWTQEFQVRSTSNSRIKWIGGLYYFTESTGTNILELDGLFLPAPTYYDRTIQVTNSYSGFGQATAPILPGTNVTVGLRYTVDQRSLQAYSASDNAPNSPESATYRKPTYRFALDHQFAPDAMGYIGYSRGFKSGVFNVLVPPGASIEPPVKPEVLDAYTVGAKTEWLDHRVRVNVEGFFYKYSDIQIQATVNSLNVLTNAASATIKGIDLDTVFEPVRNLTITANAEVLHGRYTSLEKGLLYVYQPVTGGNTTTVADLSGNDTVHSPPFSFSSSVNYKISVANLGDLALSATFSHTLSYFAGVDNAKGQSASTADRQATYSLVSTSANWTPTNGQWGVRFWGKNLTDHHYWSESSLLSFASQYSPAPPRTFGVDFTFSFGK